MDAKEFNKCLRKFHNDKEMQVKLCLFCVGVIKKHLKGRFGNRNDLEDLAHDIFLQKIYVKSFHHLRPVGNPEAWLARISDNYVYSYIKTEHRMLSLLDEYDYAKVSVLQQISYELNFPDEPNDELTQSCLAKLDEDSRKIVVLFYIYQVSLRDVSKMMNMTYAAIRKKSSRAMKLLEFYVTNECKDLSL